MATLAPLRTQSIGYEAFETIAHEHGVADYYWRLQAMDLNEVLYIAGHGSVIVDWIMWGFSVVSQILFVFQPRKFV